MKPASSAILVGDCLDIMRAMPPRSVDLVFTSSPYEAARTYGIDFKLRGQDWVDWAFVRYMEILRVCKGLVAWNCEGQTRNYRWSAVPALLMADLHRAGVHLRKPPIFKRVGIPGSGGPDWLRNDYEFIICATNGGKLPWSCNTAMGKPPKWAPGGEMSHRLGNGTKRNQWGGGVNQKSGPRKSDGTRGTNSRPSHLKLTKADKLEMGGRLHTKAGVDGEMVIQAYLPPTLANPGNVVDCVVGGGLMGDPLAHENEAPFPEELAEFFIKSFCPPGGIVLDPFCGSGTTCAVAKKWGREYIGIDIRQSQVDLTNRRLAEIAPLFAGASA